MSDEHFNAVCREPLPLQPWTEATAREAVEQATQLDAMRRVGNGDPWRLVAGEWHTLLRTARSRATRAQPDGDPVEALRLIQMEIRGYELPAAVIEERLRMGIEAQVWLDKRAKLRLPPKEPRRPGSAEQALLGRRRGELAMALVQHEGWPPFVRRLADRAWAAAWLKTVCPPEMGPTCDALVKALEAPIRKVQECIDLGAGAEAWFQEQEAKEKEGD